MKIDNRSFIRSEGKLEIGDWFCSKFRTENKFFHFVKIKEITKDGYVCDATNATYSLNDVLYKAEIKKHDDHEVEKLAETILDKHFPHSFYHANGNPSERLIHDNDCERCRYDDRILPAIIDALKTKEEK